MKRFALSSLAILIATAAGYFVGFRAGAEGEVMEAGQRAEYFRRVVGLPGDRIEVRDRVVLVNGNRMREP